MNKIYNFSDLSIYDNMTNDFLNSFNEIITEDFKKTEYKKTQAKILSDLKLNFSLIGVYGAGITGLYPIVEKLITSEKVEVTIETVVLATITAITIIYLEEKELKPEKEFALQKDAKSLLEESRMKGVGDGIIKKIIKALQSIQNIFKMIGKHTGAIISGFIDLFSYVSLMIPMLNAVMYVIGKYDLNLDTITLNFAGLAMGIGTIITKHGILDIINKIKDRFPVDKKIIDEIETPVIQKFGDGDYSKTPIVDDDVEMIQEQ